MKITLTPEIADSIEVLVRHVMDDDNFGDNRELAQAAERTEVWLASQQGEEQI